MEARVHFAPDILHLTLEFIDDILVIFYTKSKGKT